MAKIVIVSHDATIIEGVLNGMSGRVVAYDYPENEVIIELDANTCVTVTSEMIQQTEPCNEKVPHGND